MHCWSLKFNYLAFFVFEVSKWTLLVPPSNFVITDEQNTNELTWYGQSIPNPYTQPDCKQKRKRNLNPTTPHPSPHHWRNLIMNQARCYNLFPSTTPMVIENGASYFHGQGSSSFEMKLRVSISWSRLNILNLTIHRLPHHLKF